MKFDIGDFYLRSVKKIQIQLKLAQNIGHLFPWNTSVPQKSSGTAAIDSVMLPCCSEVSLAELQC
jgi:hypothetical protein